jgi:hypothetical protein
MVLMTNASSPRQLRRENLSTVSGSLEAGDHSVDPQCRPTLWTNDRRVMDGGGVTCATILARSRELPCLRGPFTAANRCDAPPG